MSPCWQHKTLLKKQELTVLVHRGEACRPHGGSGWYPPRVEPFVPAGQAPAAAGFAALFRGKFLGRRGSDHSAGGCVPCSKLASRLALQRRYSVSRTLSQGPSASVRWPAPALERLPAAWRASPCSAAPRNLRSAQSAVPLASSPPR